MIDFCYLDLQAQARECLFEKLELQSKESRDIDVSLDLAQEASQVKYLLALKSDRKSRVRDLVLLSRKIKFYRIE